MKRSRSCFAAFCQGDPAPHAAWWSRSAPTACASGPSAGGFTLVEIMIVIAVVAIVFAIGAPSFARMVQKEPMRQAVSDVVEALGQARAQAILRGAAVEFVLSGEGVMRVVPANNRESLTRTALAADVEAGEARDTGAGSSFTAVLGEDIAVTLLEVNFRTQMEATEARVRFHPNGTSDDFTIVLESGLEMRRIWLDPITALADLEILR
jgi:prepilin-type N-terminal cleavage/methylation domain-containing protein